MSTDMPKGRGPTITQDMREAIRDIHLEHPDWPAKSFEEPLREKFGWGPEERAIQKVRKKGLANLKDKKVFNLLQTWNLGKLDEYPVSSEAIPYILKVKKHVDGLYSGSTPSRFTVWQAKWVARLYITQKDTRTLWKISAAYASEELRSIFTDTKPDTSKLDELLLKRDCGNLFTEYMRNLKRHDTLYWILEPGIFYGSKSWEELKELYSGKDGEK